MNDQPSLRRGEHHLGRRWRKTPLQTQDPQRPQIAVVNLYHHLEQQSKMQTTPTPTMSSPIPSTVALLEPSPHLHGRSEGRRTRQRCRSEDGGAYYKRSVPASRHRPPTLGAHWERQEEPVQRRAVRQTDPVQYGHHTPPCFSRPPDDVDHTFIGKTLRGRYDAAKQQFPLITNQGYRTSRTWRRPC